MMILIEAEQGKITSDMSFAGYMGAKSSETSIDVKLIPIQGLSIEIPQIKFQVDEILPIGSVAFVKRAAELLSISLPKPLNIPESLFALLGRKVWTQRKSELKEFPCFIKPLDDVKLFTGFVAKSQNEIDKLQELHDWDGMLLCSEPLDKIVSEWRCYVYDRNIFNCSCYRGDSLAFPNREKIIGILENYENAPLGYSLDVAVTNSGTYLIECNDAWALGYYGGDFSDYFQMVKARWFEIVAKSEFI